MALRRPTAPRKPTLCPGPWIAPSPGARGAIARRDPHLRKTAAIVSSMGRAGCWNCGAASAERTAAEPGFQREPPRPLCPARSGECPGRGPLRMCGQRELLCTIQPAAIGSRPCHRSRGAPAGLRLGRFFVWISTTLGLRLGRPTGSAPGPLDAAGREAHSTANSRGAGAGPTGPPGGGRSACTGSATSPRLGRHAQPGAGGQQHRPRLQERGPDRDLGCGFQAMNWAG